MVQQTRSRSRAQPGDEKAAAARRSRSASPRRSQESIRQRPYLPPIAGLLSLPSSPQRAGRQPQLPAIAEYLNPPVHNPSYNNPLTTRITSLFYDLPSAPDLPDDLSHVGTSSPSAQGAGRRPLAGPFQSGLFEGVPSWELDRNRRTRANPHQRAKGRATTPISDQANWGSDPSPVIGEPDRPRPGFARTLDVTENFATDPPRGLHGREYYRAEPLAEESMIETIEPEGRDPLSALIAQRDDHLAVEQRQRHALVDTEGALALAEGRIRGLEEVQERLVGIIRGNRAQQAGKPAAQLLDLADSEHLGTDILLY
ncbi:MAG: hypothetical protein Q9166_006027 [cf. Caloplaca sp. 2 TL-2023]